MKRKFWLIMVIALIALVSCVNADSGTLGATGTNSTYYTTTTGAGGHDFNTVAITDIQYTVGTTAIILFNTVKNSYAAGADIGTSVPFVMTVPASTNTTIGTGFVGYQRSYTTGGVEQPGYTYIQFSHYDPGALTGSVSAKIWCNVTALGLTATGGNAGGYAPPSGYFGFGEQPNNVATGQYLVVKDVSTLNDWVATSDGTWITGSITKSSGGQNYSSQAFLFNASGYTLSSQSTSTPLTFNFTSIHQPIKLGIRTPNAVWYNTSILFTPAVTPTPTVSPTQPVTPDNPIPVGYIRSKAQCVNGQTSGTIQSCQLSMYDNQASVWTNGTWYGTWFIDTLPNHTINIYGTATGYSPVSRLGMVASDSIMYELIMWPTDVTPAPAGKVNLFVIISDSDTGNSITGAQVSARDDTGITQVKTTGTSGTVQFQVANSSLSYVSSSKYGYTPASEIIMTSASGSDTLRIEMFKQVITVAPTATIPPAGVTTAVTMDPRSDTEKDLALMDQIRTAGPDLIGLAIIATMMGLLGMIMKFGK